MPTRLKRIVYLFAVDSGWGILNRYTSSGMIAQTISQGCFPAVLVVNKCSAFPFAASNNNNNNKSK